MTDDRGYLDGVRVLEVGTELGEYCGKLLAGFGADVVRVEPPGGEVTRTYGPFYKDQVHRDRSLYFWHYNVGKRSIELDLDSPSDQEIFRSLAGSADVLLESRPVNYFAERGLAPEQLRGDNSGLIISRISAYGDSGPWAEFAGSDLVHLALGGVVMNCGYDPDLEGEYDTPPVAPQMWQAYQITGEINAIAILGALNFLATHGTGQYLTTSVHQAVSQSTETDLPNWIFLRQPHYRLTCRHSAPTARGPSLSQTKDGRYLLPYRTYVRSSVNAWDGTAELLRRLGCSGDLEDPKYRTEFRDSAAATDHLAALTDRVVERTLFSRELWRDAQELGLPWAPVRRPEENLADPHWHRRHTFCQLFHPELDESVTHIGAKWMDDDVRWRCDRRPPLCGEHTAEVVEEWARVERSGRHERRPRGVTMDVGGDTSVSVHGRPFALTGIRVIDLGWMLASAGAGRFLAALGAEVIKVEHHTRWDGMRFGLATCPAGGRAERAAATGPLAADDGDSPNRSGVFMDINAGKLGVSLNLKTDAGRNVLEKLIASADVLIEGFSPGTMKRMGLGYDRLKEIKPDLIYVQQSGLGETGCYGRVRTYGPSAAAFSGLSEMSGLPEPFPPAGIGYSYLDWFGAYNAAQAVLAALYRRRQIGVGCHIDASQSEVGIYLSGTAVLDYAVNGRRWQRYGNRSPYKRAAPHGIYPTSGIDEWIAVGAFSEHEWHALAECLGLAPLCRDARFENLDQRILNADALDQLVGTATRDWSARDLMASLQARGVPAGVCQTAEDRCDRDPQLRSLQWLVELEQAEIGRWPVRGFPVDLSDTPAHMGGRYDRSGPSYGQDTHAVLTGLCGLTDDEVEALRNGGVI